MEKKNRFIVGAFLFSLILLMGLASATITFDSPTTAGDTVTGSYQFNVTSTLTSVFYCNWSTTADGHFVGIQNESDDVFNVTFDTTSLTDAEDTTLTVNCSVEDGSDSEIGTLVINIDNADPVCSFSLSIGEETIDFMDAYGIYPNDASTDTTDLTYAWILYDPSSNSQQTSTSSTPNFAGLDFDEIGDFVLTLTVTDEASKTHACTNQTIMVKGTNDDGGGVVSSVETFIESNQTTIIVLGSAILAILLVVSAFYIIKKSKK